MGATGLYLFGSVATGSARPGSDVDIFIDHESGTRFSLLDLVGLKQYLEDEIEMPVDITTRDSLHPKLRPEIERSAIRVF